MERNEAHTSYWKVIAFDVDEANSIHQLEGKLPGHLDSIQSVVISCNPIEKLDATIPECGELSLCLNNRKAHVLHTITNYTAELSDKIGQTLELHANLESNAKYGGYYRDFGKLKNGNGDFVPYQVKLMMNCSSKS